MNKKGQLAVFVVIAIVLVISIALIFVFLQLPILKTSASEDPQTYIEECIMPHLKEAVNMIKVQGSYIEPNPFVRYKEENVGFLCYTEKNNALCISQRPMLVSNMQEEVKNYVQPKIEDCFQKLGKELAKYNYQEEPTTFEVKIVPEKTMISIDKKISFTKNEQPQSYEYFDLFYYTDLFNFAKLSNEIINQELDCDCQTESCHADVLQMSLDNNDYEISLLITGRNEDIYLIENLATEEYFAFAIRNCVQYP